MHHVFGLSGGCGMDGFGVQDDSGGFLAPMVDRERW